MHTHAGRHDLAQRRHGGIHDNLKVRRAGPVVEFKKIKCTLPLLPIGLDPTPDLDGLTSKASAVVGTGEDGTDQDTVGELSLVKGVETPLLRDANAICSTGGAESSAIGLLWCCDHSVV